MALLIHNSNFSNENTQIDKKIGYNLQETGIKEVGKNYICPCIIQKHLFVTRDNKNHKYILCVVLLIYNNFEA